MSALLKNLSVGDFISRSENLREEDRFDRHDDWYEFFLVVGDVGAVGCNFIVNFDSHFFVSLDSLNGVAVDRILGYDSYVDGSGVNSRNNRFELRNDKLDIGELGGQLGYIV